MRALACVTVALGVGTVLAGCGWASDDSAGKPRVTLIVGLRGDDFYGSMACGAKRAAKELGVELDVQGGDKWEPGSQLPVLNAAVNTQPDAILIAPVSDTALQAPLEQAADKGIEVVLVDTTVKDPGFATAQVTSDDELAGKKAAEEVVRETGGNGSVVTINTQPGVTTTAARVRGFEEHLKSQPGLRYLGEQFSGDDAAKAASKVSSALSANPDLGAVFAINTLTGQGAATGIKNAHKTGDVKLIGFDGNPSGVEALKDGTAQGQVVLQPLDIGYQGVQQAVNALDGKPVDKLIRTGSFVATKENLDEPRTQKYLYRESCTG